MFKKPQDRLTTLWEQARAVTKLADFYAVDAVASLRRRPVSSFAAAVALAAGGAFLALGDEPANAAPATTPVAATPTPTLLERPVREDVQPDLSYSVDSAPASDTERDGHIATLGETLSAPVGTAANIRRLQATLNALEYPTGRVDGIAGPRTATAIMDALRAHPALAADIAPWVVETLLANGQRRTLGTFLSDNAAAQQAARAVIENPAAQVRDKQIWLSAHGHYRGNIDNLRGPETRAAERHFIAATTLPPAPTPPQEATPAPQVAPLQQSPVQQPSLPQSAQQDPAFYGTALTAAQITELETILNRGGYYQHKAGGKFTSTLGGALVEYLRDNQEQLANLSPWVLQNMMRHNYQQDLVAMMYNNPATRKAIRAKIESVSANLGRLGEQPLAEAQIWMKMTGLYTGPVTGRMNGEFRAAINDFRGFNTAAPPPAAGVAAPSADIRTLAQDNAFRAALREGNLRKTVQMLESLDATPARLAAPLRVMNLTSHFQPLRKTRLDHRHRPHKGTDYGAPAGTPIYAPMDGVVVFNDYSGRSKKRGYGETIIISHGHGIHTLFAHRLNRGTHRVGDQVRAGDIVGKVGSTGGSTGAHLHYEIILHDTAGRPVVINAAKFAQRNLKDPQVQQEAIADSRLTMRASGRSGASMSPMGHHFPADRPVLTAATGKALNAVLAADPALQAVLSPAIRTAMARDGHGQTLARLDDRARVIPASYRP